MNVDDDKELEPVLEFLRDTRGFDFTAYKGSSLARRTRKRLQTLNLSGFAAYQEYLEQHPEEFGVLFNTILINVTSFFRDPDTWSYLADEVAPRVLGQIKPDGHIRAWSAGCASGQEAYTLAMILAEQVGREQFRRRVKIFASDIDEDALGQARHAMYTREQVQDVPPHLLERYFGRVDDRYIFDKEVRRSIIFGRHDIVQDAPISRVHFLVCRNTLMYFTRDTQARVLSRFHFALRDTGVLFMGKAELLLTHGDLFAPVDLKQRIFRKVMNHVGSERSVPLEHQPRSAAMSVNDRIEALAIDADPVARIIVRADGRVALINDRARTLFHLTAADIGKRLHDLEVSYRPLELRSAIEEVIALRRNAPPKEVAWSRDSGETRFIEVQIAPLLERSGAVVAVQISFADVTRQQRLREEVDRAKNELETTNEELQSTNEELETMNEELQSTNEELETINTELRLRSDELNHTNAFLASILAGLDAGVVVVDSDLKVLAWNSRSEELWRLRTDEVVGQHLMNLDIGLPLERLLQPVRAVLGRESSREDIAVDCTNRRGRLITCHIQATPLAAADGQVAGVIVMMKEDARPPAS